MSVQAGILQSDDVHGREATRLGWIGLGATLAMLLLFVFWSALAPLASTVVAEGVVKSDRNRRLVQHQEGGTIAAIRVRDGDRVNAGQVLVQLDDPRARAELRKVQSLLDSELARIARLEAERDGAVAYTLPAELAPRMGDADLAAVVARERQAFAARRASLDAQLALLASAKAEAGHEADALRMQVREVQSAAEKMEQEVAVNEALLKENFVQKTRVTALQRSVHEYRMRQGEAQADIAQALQRQSDLELRARSLRTGFADAAHSELRLSADRVEQLRAQFEPNAEAVRRQQIVAPVAGTVMGLKINTVGGVVAPGQAVLAIVPDDAPLVVEGRLRTDAVAQVPVGTHASVRLPAYDQRTTQPLDGTVRYVSADRESDSQGNTAYYVIEVEVAASAAASLRDQALTAGMPVEIYLGTGERTALDFLIDPLTHRLRMALRDK